MQDKLRLIKHAIEGSLVQISAQSMIATSELALDCLARAPAGASLRLPSNFRHLAGGAEAALAQVIISWAQQNPGGQLETFIESSSQIDDFVRRLPGLVAGLCASKATALRHQPRLRRRSVTLRSCAVTSYRVRG